MNRTSNFAGHKHTMETKAEMSRTRKGRKHTAKTKEKMSKAKLGKPFSAEHRRNISRVRLGYKLTAETKAKLRQINLGKKLSEETKSKISKSNLGKKNSAEHRRNISRGRLGYKLTAETKEKIRRANLGKRASIKTKAKMSKSHKRLWLDPEYAKKRFKAYNVRPTIPEKNLNSILDSLFPNDYKYVGNGKVWFGGKNPDFINVNGQKKIIELFGDYFHGKLITGKTEQQNETERINHFKKFGFNTLIIWQRELKNESKLIEKILEYNGGVI